MIRPEFLERLRKFDTPTICNIIELFDARPRNLGFMDARIAACFPEMPAIVGYAATATFRSSSPPRQSGLYSSLDKQVERFAELSGPAFVVFQDLDSPSVAATFGEIMCTTYKEFGAVGLVTSGAGRDLEQIHQLGFPVFTNGTICAHGYSSIPQVHVPVHVGGIAVYPDDLLHADRNGVTTIPKEIASEVADIGDEYIAAEMVIIEAVKRAPADLKVLRESQLESKSQIERLRARVRRKV